MGKCLEGESKERNKASSNFTVLTTIWAESVGPLGHIYQWFSPVPIFNVDSHHTGTDTTVERNIETRNGKGEFYFETKEFGITMPSHNGQLHFSSVNGWMELKKGGPTTFGPDCRTLTLQNKSVSFDFIRSWAFWTSISTDHNTVF